MLSKSSQGNLTCSFEFCALKNRRLQRLTSQAWLGLSSFLPINANLPPEKLSLRGMVLHCLIWSLTVPATFPCMELMKESRWVSLLGEYHSCHGMDVSSVSQLSRYKMAIITLYMGGMKINRLKISRHSIIVQVVAFKYLRQSNRNHYSHTFVKWLWALWGTHGYLLVLGISMLVPFMVESRKYFFFFLLGPSALCWRGNFWELL